MAANQITKREEPMISTSKSECYFSFNAKLLLQVFWAVVFAVSSHGQYYNPVPIELKPPIEDQEISQWASRICPLPETDGDGTGEIALSSWGGTPIHVYDVGTGAMQTRIGCCIGSFAGISISGIPGTNGNGTGDLLVGGKCEDDTWGCVRLFDGFTGDTLNTISFPNAGAAWFGEPGSSDYPLSVWFGYSVSGVPDLTGDGRMDFVVGAPLDRNPTDLMRIQGQAYIFDGASGGLLHTLTSPNPQTDGYFGIRVVGVSDLNNDGYGDVVVGTGIEHKIYIFNGFTGSHLRTLVSMDSQDSPFGIIGSIQDCNGDSVDDLVIVGYVGGGTQSAYILDGTTGTVLRTFSPPNAEHGGAFSSLSGIHDVNGDGFGDLLVGSFWGETPSRAYILDGASGQILQTLYSPHVGDLTHSAFGGPVCSVRDANGDNVDEVIVADTVERRAYIFLSLEQPSSVGNWGHFK